MVVPSLRIAPWLMAATTIDSYIHVFIIWSWVLYKEANWITAILWAVLLVCFRRTETEQWRKYSLLTARILSLALGSLMLGTLIYILVTYGSPFHRDAFTPWMSATLIDYFVIVIALSDWVAYKESSAAFWIIPIILCGSPITCAYIALQLFSLSSGDPVYLVLFSSHNRYFQGAVS